MALFSRPNMSDQRALSPVGGDLLPRQMNPRSANGPYIVPCPPSSYHIQLVPTRAKPPSSFFSQGIDIVILQHRFLEPRPA